MPCLSEIKWNLNRFVFCLSNFQLFDSLAKKKTKKKKVPFDLDAEIGESGGDNVEKGDASKEQDAANEFDENLDLESFGKKKKKKKKPFNLDELEQNLPTETDENKDEGVNDGAGEEGANVEEEFDFDVDFSKTKKKKKKKKDLDELVAEPLDENQQAAADHGNVSYILHSLRHKSASPTIDWHFSFISSWIHAFSPCVNKSRKGFLWISV